MIKIIKYIKQYLNVDDQEVFKMKRFY